MTLSRHSVIGWLPVETATILDAGRSAVTGRFGSRHADRLVGPVPALLPPDIKIVATVRRRSRPQTGFGPSRSQLGTFGPADQRVLREHSHGGGEGDGSC